MNILYTSINCFYTKQDDNLNLITIKNLINNFIHIDDKIFTNIYHNISNDISINYLIVYDNKTTIDILLNNPNKYIIYNNIIINTNHIDIYNYLYYNNEYSLLNQTIYNTLNNQFNNFQSNNIIDNNIILEKIYNNSLLYDDKTINYKLLSYNNDLYIELKELLRIVIKNDDFYINLKKSNKKNYIFKIIDNKKKVFLNQDGYIEVIKLFLTKKKNPYIINYLNYLLDNKDILYKF